MTLREVIETAQGLSKEASEADTQRVVVDLLRELGWRGGSIKEQWHVAESGKGSGGIVDIALFTDSGHATVLVEVKRPGATLAERKHVEQLFAYASQHSVPICILTNAHVWQLYLPGGHGSYEDRLAEKIEVRERQTAELEQSFRHYLRQKTMIEGEAEERVTAALKQRRLEQTWHKILSRPPRDLLALIQKEAPPLKTLRWTQEEIREFLVGIATGQPSSESVVNQSPSTPPSTAPTPTSSASKKKTRNSKPRKKPSSFVLFGDRHFVNSWATVLVGVAEQLHQRHESGFYQALELRGKRRKQPLIGRFKEDVFRGRRISDSEFWIDTNYSSERTVYWCHELLKTFGYSPDELQIE